MTSNANERVVLNARPDSRAVIFQFRNLLKLGIAGALMLPSVQATFGGSLNGLRLPGLTVEVREWLLVAPSVLLVLHVFYWFAYQKTCSFTLTDERLIVRYGLLLRVEDEVELYRVVDVTQTISLVQRLLGVGNIQVTSTDRTGLVVMPLIKSPSGVRNAVRTEAERCKSRRGSVRILE
jgi:uncharacterized membrane protein YdbT with pleckstrin-like domain